MRVNFFAFTFMIANMFVSEARATSFCIDKLRDVLIFARITNDAIPTASKAASFLEEQGVEFVINTKFKNQILVITPSEKTPLNRFALRVKNRYGTNLVYDYTANVRTNQLAAFDPNANVVYLPGHLFEGTAIETSSIHELLHVRSRQYKRDGYDFVMSGEVQYNDPRKGAYPFGFEEDETLTFGYEIALATYMLRKNLMNSNLNEIARALNDGNLKTHLTELYSILDEVVSGSQEAVKKAQRNLTNEDNYGISRSGAKMKLEVSTGDGTTLSFPILDKATQDLARKTMQRKPDETAIKTLDRVVLARLLEREILLDKVAATLATARIQMAALGPQSTAKEFKEYVDAGAELWKNIKRGANTSVVDEKFIQSPALHQNELREHLTRLIFD